MIIRLRNKILYGGSLILLIITILMFIGILFIAFNIDIEQIMNGTGQFTIRVENKSNSVMRVHCYVYNTSHSEPPHRTINPGETGIFSYEYIKNKRITDIHIYATTTNMTDSKDTLHHWHRIISEFPENIHAYITENADDIIIIDETYVNE